MGDGAVDDSRLVVSPALIVPTASASQHRAVQCTRRQLSTERIVAGWTGIRGHVPVVSNEGTDGGTVGES